MPKTAGPVSAPFKKLRRLALCGGFISGSPLIRGRAARITSINGYLYPGAIAVMTGTSAARQPNNPAKQITYATIKRESCHNWLHRSCFERARRGTLWVPRRKWRLKSGGFSPGGSFPWGPNIIDESGSIKCRSIYLLLAALDRPERLGQRPSHRRRRLIHSGKRSQRSRQINRCYTLVVFAGYERLPVEGRRHMAVIRPGAEVRSACKCAGPLHLIGAQQQHHEPVSTVRVARSEERRVGKECRSR